MMIFNYAVLGFCIRIVNHIQLLFKSVYYNNTMATFFRKKFSIGFVTNFISDSLILNKTFTF